MGKVIIPGQRNCLEVSGTLNAVNTTASITLVTFTGTLINCKIAGIVTTALGSNVTAAHWRTNDGTNQAAITLATGTTLSSAPAGTKIAKSGLAAAALTSNTSAQVRVVEHATSGMAVSTPFDLVAKAGATNTIEFRYTTTLNPCTGVILFYFSWEPGSSDASAV